MNLKGFQVRRGAWHAWSSAVLLLQGCTSLRGPDPADPLEPHEPQGDSFQRCG